MGVADVLFKLMNLN